MSKLPSWHFRTMEAGEVHVDPVHDEFFKMQDLADALVRESIQNSLDARRGRTPVRVRFRFGTGADTLSPEAAAQYFGGLYPHLHAVSSAIHSSIPAEDESVPYLLIEDFGTRGLTGEPDHDPELGDAETAKNDFFYFWRNVGRSSKGELDRGRWGLGKAVFSVASRIRTIFGLTVRADDGRALLLGQSVLKTHVLDGERIYPYGFFARFEKRSGLPLPIEDPLLLERFADDFQLARSEPGFSVVVPFFRPDELSFDRLLQSAIAQYFYPITRGDLIVDVEEMGRRQSINKQSIEDIAGAGDRLCALTRWSLTDAADRRIELAAPASERAPKWSEELVPGEQLQELRDAIDRGERIAIRVPVLVKRKRSKAASSFFDVFLEKDDSLRRLEVHFIRRGITIPDVKTTGATDKPLRALVVIDHEALSTFLGDSENPAHSDWSERADKLRTLYDHHAATLRFVKNSAAFLSALVSRPPEGRVRDFLEDIFAIDARELEGKFATRARLPIRGSRSPAAQQAMGGAVGNAPLTIVRVAGGFALRGTGETNTERPMVAEMAYRVRSGNPFRRHSPFDFDVAKDEIAIESEGAVVERAGANRIRFTPLQPKFQITMKGFDANRDLVVRVSDVSDAPETELH